jgi:hypothetical protein
MPRFGEQVFPVVLPCEIRREHEQQPQSHGLPAAGDVMNGLPIEKEQVP